MNNKAKTDQGPTLSNPCNCFYLRRAARLITRQYAETMKPIGLRSGQFSILSVLANFDSLTITELAEKLGLERTSLSRALRPMEKEKLISISSEKSQRRRYVELTKLGKSVLKKAVPYWNKAQQQFADQLGENDIIVLQQLLKRTSEVVLTS